MTQPHRAKECNLFLLGVRAGAVLFPVHVIAIDIQDADAKLQLAGCGPVEAPRRDPVAGHPTDRFDINSVKSRKPVKPYKVDLPHS